MLAERLPFDLLWQGCRKPSECLAVVVQPQAARAPVATAGFFHPARIPHTNRPAIPAGSRA